MESSNRTTLKDKLFKTPYKVKDDTIESLHEQTKVLERELGRLREENIRLNKEKVNTNNLLDSLIRPEAPIDHGSEVLQEALEKVSALTESCQSLKNELESSKRSNSTLTEKVEDLKRTNKELDQQLVQQTRNFSSLETENQKIAFRPFFSEDENQSLQKKCKILETEKKELKQQLQSTEEKLDKSYRDFHSKVKKCGELEQKCAALEREQVNLLDSTIAKLDQIGGNPGTIQDPEVTRVTESKVQK